ncbi:ABC transporter substrate-binding protein [Solemya pervernicosa gill symbiont]|uniref:ABC transporter substrate-binding protein n=3 Tax=Gammaproteobacteria incertae sedis TaxID=118884 RepID=A0A1T2L117_9GAMM|nr:extracellular solute-binding protein [Solemya pervernicosa gill symbiont]OOZ38772.1 ABC transporter substrate-binding protein [Solemya pervernicosa gill symbiont]QKQ28217.1 ABC transporter substrate-binding protein [Candidatus Reidiella endopervernicosa]
MISWRHLNYLLMLLSLLSIPFGLQAAPAQALGYEPKYPPGFDHFDYVNPDAPKTGKLVLSVTGSFDSFNPYVLKGLSADGLTPLMIETLMASSLDEPFSQYGLLAEDAALAEDKRSVTFRLRPEARFNDGSVVTAEDVKFSFDSLKGEKGHPQYRFYYADIERAVVVDSRTVRFEFTKVNPELHMIAGQIPIFSRNWVGDKAFDKVAMEPPIASGPYTVESFDIGKNITYRRNPNYWGRDLNVRRGMFNFERITYKYYRDATVALEAFKAGEFEFIHEYNSKKWARDYIGPKFRDGRIVKQNLKHSNNAGMQGFVFNLRRPLFKDLRVRQAISQALDFDWSNRKLFYNQYERCDSYFSNSELAARGLPEGDELALLEPLRDELRPEVFTETWQPPTTKAPASLRSNLRKAKALLQEAGWVYRDGALRNAKGEKFSFEVILAQKGFERILAPFARNLTKLGIEVEYRTVDIALYQRRIESFDFDMVVGGFGQSQSPGNELMGMFHSSSAQQKGSRNTFGIEAPAVDALVDALIYAKDRSGLVTAARALDRVLLNGYYLVPHWYIGSHRIAYWDRFGMPESLPLYYNADSWMLATWWKRAEKTGATN